MLDDPQCLSAWESVFSEGARHTVILGEPDTRARQGDVAPSLAMALEPVTVDGQVVAVLQWVKAPSPPPTEFAQWQPIFDAVTDLAVDFEINAHRRELLIQAAQWRDYDRLLVQLHGETDLRRSSYLLVNETRRLLGCDRVTLATRRGNRARLEAISGVDTFDRRTASVRQLERLATIAMRLGESMWWRAGDGETVSPVVYDVEAYADIAHVRLVGLIPLALPCHEDDPPSVVGTIIVEEFGDRDVSDWEHRLATISRHAASAVSRGLKWRRVPGIFRRNRLPWESAAQKSRRLATLAIMICALVGAVILGCWPVSFSIEGRGTLQPSERRNLYAPFDGQVRRLQVRPNDRVTEGQVLMELRSSQIDLESRRIQGELDAARERLRAIESARIMGSREGDRAVRASELSAAQQELTRLLESYQRQLGLLRRQRELLSIRSPMDGTVISWDIEKRLRARPVRQGDLLLTVADLEGDWVLKLNVPDHEIGHVVDAQQASQDPLAVSVLLETRPDVPMRGHIREISPAVTQSASGAAVVPVEVVLERAGRGAFYPGATAVAKISCGRRSAAYVWSRQLVEFCQRHFWW